MSLKHSPSVIMATLENLGWVKSNNISLKGQYYFLPRGTVVFHLIADLLKFWVQKELGAKEIKTPILYDWYNQSIQAESANFVDRVFHTEYGTRKCVLRPGGDYGVLSLVSSQNIYESNLPICLYEVATSFRKNQTRESMGLLRAQCFTLLDLHIFAKDIAQGWDTYSSIVLAQAKLGNLFNLNWQLTIEIEDAFLNEHSLNIASLEKKIGKTIKIVRMKGRKNYWHAQHQFTDNDDGIGFSDGQYDLINAENYNIQFKKSNTPEKGYPIICHGSFDSIERWMYKFVSRAIADNGYSFPVWLCPIHIRMLCQDEAQVSLIREQLEVYIERGIRIEVDMTNKSISKRIQKSLNEWVPFTVILPKDFTNFDLNYIKVVYLNKVQEELFLQEVCEKINKCLLYKLNIENTKYIDGNKMRVA